MFIKILLYCLYPFKNFLTSSGNGRAFEMHGHLAQGYYDRSDSIGIRKALLV